MRPRVSWMTRADDAILEFLSETGIAANPSTIAYNIEYNRSYVARRCKTLDDHSLMNRVDEPKAMYEITQLGRDYLNGEVEADVLEDQSA